MAFIWHFLRYIFIWNISKSIPICLLREKRSFFIWITRVLRITAIPNDLMANLGPILLLNNLLSNKNLSHLAFYFNQLANVSVNWLPRLPRLLFPIDFISSLSFVFTIREPHFYCHRFLANSAHEMPGWTLWLLGLFGSFVDSGCFLRKAVYCSSLYITIP